MMKTKARKYNSIAFRMAAILIVIIISQGVIMSILMVAGGVIHKTEENAFSFFASQVNSRKSILENQMKNVWTSIDKPAEDISRYFSVQRNINQGKEDNEDALLEGIAPYLIESLYTTKTTGVFLILDDEEKDGKHSGLYIRNSDPSNIGTDNFNLFMMVGPWNVAKTMGVTTSEKWNFQLQLDDSNKSFYENPYKYAGLTDNKELLGYWNPPFPLSEGDYEAITYSIPISDNRGNFIGVFGVEISVDYLYDFLPKTELQSEDSYGYIIAIKQEGETGMVPLINQGALQERMLNLREPLDLKLLEPEHSIYEIENTKDLIQLYGCVEKMGMYYNNTPFDEEEWYLIGMRQRNSLFEFSRSIAVILGVSLTITLVIGIIFAVMASRKFTQPILALSQQVRAYSLENFAELKETGLAEIDDLSDAIRVSHKEMETLANTLRVERDRDSLTGIGNRNAFNVCMEEYNKTLNQNSSIAMGMFDLNELKFINDNYGHEVGDWYICFAADTIKTIFAECPVFRIGGDEFAAILVDFKTEEIESMHRQMTRIVEENKELGSYSNSAGIAFGYAFYDHRIDITLENVSTRADANMYINKKEMKNIR